MKLIIPSEEIKLYVKIYTSKWKDVKLFWKTINQLNTSAQMSNLLVLNGNNFSLYDELLFLWKKKINWSRTFLFGTIRNLIYSVNTYINNVKKIYFEIVLLEILDKTDRSLYFEISYAILPLKNFIFIFCVVFWQIPYI
jgi:hypothetical protein